MLVFVIPQNMAKVSVRQTTKYDTLLVFVKPQNMT